VAVFGYFNPNPQAITIPIGANNNFTPGSQDRLQPITFQPGRQQSVFTVSSAGASLVWSLNGNMVTVSPNDPRQCKLSPLYLQLLQQRNPRNRSFQGLGRSNN
jgi:hypothetical protein